MEGIHLVLFSQEKNISMSVDAKRMNKRQQEILDSISHELRTPVTIMKSTIQLLKKCCMGSGNPLVEESFLMCEESVDNILRYNTCVGFLSDMDHMVVIPMAPFIEMNAPVEQSIGLMAQY